MHIFMCGVGIFALLNNSPFTLLPKPQYISYTFYPVFCVVAKRAM